jgi:hypothetical protein
MLVEFTASEYGRTEGSIHNSVHLTRLICSFFQLGKFDVCMKFESKVISFLAPYFGVL